MKFSEYQKKSKETAIYPKDKKFCYLALGLSGEAGEVSDIFKKTIRDDRGEISMDKKEKIEKELGDVLWYISQIATELELDLSEVAKLNLEKLSSRKKREKLGGSGDNR